MAHRTTIRLTRRNSGYIDAHKRGWWCSTHIESFRRQVCPNFKGPKLKIIISTNPMRGGQMMIQSCRFDSEWIFTEAKDGIHGSICLTMQQLRRIKAKLNLTEIPREVWVKAGRSWL